MLWSHEEIVVRPFPEVDTPHYEAKYGRGKAKYQICHGNTVLTEMLELEAAIKYAKQYIKTRFNEDVQELSEDTRSGYLYRYITMDGCYENIAIKEIK